jgi:hypothetical protein
MVSCSLCFSLLFLFEISKYEIAGKTKNLISNVIRVVKIKLRGGEFNFHCGILVLSYN